MDLTADLGSYVEHNGRPAVRFRRTYAYPIERVWSAITDSIDLTHWFPAPDTRIEPRAGGVVDFRGDPHTDDNPGTVLAWEPPTYLAYTWGGDELHFRLEGVDASTCQLTLIDVLDERDAAARNAGGWFVCLAELAKTVAGTPGDGPHGDSVVAPWSQVYGAHVDAGLPHGAPIPDLPSTQS